MSTIPTAAKTDKGHAILTQFREELKRFTRKQHSNITKELFLEFVKDCDYQWYFQAGRVGNRLRLQNWAKANLALVIPWFQEAEEICPGFFKHPRDHFNRIDRQELVDACEDLDILIKLGLIPPSKSSPREKRFEQPVLQETHLPNDYNSLPKSLLEARPELERMTREEAWAHDLEQRDIVYPVVIHHIKEHLSKIIQAIEKDGVDDPELICDHLRTTIKGVEKVDPTMRFESRPNAALACILFDSTKEGRKKKREAQAKLLPTLDTDILSNLVLDSNPKKARLEYCGSLDDGDVLSKQRQTYTAELTSPDFRVESDLLGTSHGRTSRGNPR